MLYRILRILSIWALRIYFRRIYIQGLENVPSKGPCLLICNHPSSFLEACLLACFQPRELHFLVRGDLFAIKWLRPIMLATNQIPIYRFRDGFAKLRDNVETFERSREVLSKGEALLIFPEASTRMLHFLRPLQKGAARLVVGAIDHQWVQDIMVLPCGVFYHDALRSRRDVVLKFGEPISFKKWLSERSICSGADQKADDIVFAFTQRMQEAMHTVVPSFVHLRHEEIYLAALSMADIQKLPYSRGGVFRSDCGFQIVQDAVQKINQLPVSKMTELAEYFVGNRIRKSELRKYAFMKSYPRSHQMLRYAMMAVFFLIGLPGFLFHAMPLYLSRYLSYKKIKHVEFIAPVRIAISMVLVLFWYLIFWLVFALVGKTVLGICLLVGLFVSLLAYLSFTDWYNIVLPCKHLSHRRKKIIQRFESQLEAISH